jgi:hypothetical protein
MRRWDNWLHAERIMADTRTATQEGRRHGVVRGLLVLLLSGPIGLVFGYVVTFGLFIAWALIFS